MDTVTIMTAMPMTIPSTAINTMGRDKRSCLSLSPRMRRAMKWGKPMPMTATKLAACLALMAAVSCSPAQQGSEPLPVKAMSGFANEHIRVGAERMEEYLPMLDGLGVAVVSNQTGLVAGTHLVDTLLARGVRVVRVFAPEHGFRGEADAGAHVQDERDVRTGLPIVSLYGRNKKPTTAQMAGVDVVLFDIQDVGVRFYTYTSTLHYVMEACAANEVRLVVLDRPNPNGFYVDGPVLDTAHRSFVGMHPVPLVHGLTIGEYARMLNGEGWLAHGDTCMLTVVPCEGYTHAGLYELPVRPSPNLPNMAAVYLYPSLGLFEGTVVSVGRGTDQPFQCIGYPGNPVGSFRFTPEPKPGAQAPPYEGRECRGLDLREFGEFYPRLRGALYPQWLIGMYEEAPDQAEFFTPFFDKLAGGPVLRQQLQAGWDEKRIRASWQHDLDAFRKLREGYLLYP